MNKYSINKTHTGERTAWQIFDSNTEYVSITGWGKQARIFIPTQTLGIHDIFRVGVH